MVLGCIGFANAMLRIGFYLATTVFAALGLYICWYMGLQFINFVIAKQLLREANVVK